MKLLLVFFVTSSLTSLAGPISSNFHLPSVPLAHANLPPCPVKGISGACSEPWYPAGPAMNSLQDIIFVDSTAEYTNLQSFAPSIDFTDEPCTPATCQTILGSPNFLLTSPVAEQGYYELEFLLANTFWNCNFSFGNSGCGVQIRQGISHMFDKTSFVTNEPSIAGAAAAIDNPVPTSSNGGLLSPNPCGYDTSFSQTGPNCIVGAPGGTAYHIGSSTGANGKAWLYAPGSADLNAAAQHFVNAGLASSFNSATSILNNPVAGTTTPTFFIRSDDVTRKDLGESIASQICYLFTGSYTEPCSPFLTTVEGSITSFPGFGCPFPSPPCFTSLPLNWWIYTAGFSGPQFFDGSLYYTYNSRFVSGIPPIQPPNGPCSPEAVPTASPNNYMYLCNANYDSLTDQMEFSPCLIAPGDPVTGATSNLPTPPGNGLCPGTSQLSAISAAIQAEALFGSYAFTIPLYERTVQFGYLNNGWIRVINDAGHGLPNHFLWLDTWNAAPALTGTIRQGFSQTTRSVNPYIASTNHDFYVLNNIYDSLQIFNPLNGGQSINWLTYSTVQLNNATVTASSSYNPPPGTLTTYRFFLRNDAFFHDGRPVTAYDVAFSYLSLIGSGSYTGSSATSMTGITILGPKQFDIGVNSLGPFTLYGLTGLPIMPGRYWTGAGPSAWDKAVSACTGMTLCPKIQYRLNSGTVVCSPNSPDTTCASFPVNLQQVDPAKTAATFDPIANHLFIGSGPYTCGIPTSSGSGSCSSSNAQNPPVGGSYTLTRFGNGLPPASSITGMYFRSSGDLALYVWTEENDINPISAVSAVSLCFNQPMSPQCYHWQHGIGASSSGIVGINQVSIAELRYNFNWISPYEWTTNPPLGIGAFPPVLYEGSVTLNPCSIDPVNGYDC